MKKALFVGINQYKDRQIANLNCCIQDASALFGLFRTYGFDARLLIDPGEARVKNEVSSMADNLKPGDSFFFYFAGHGCTGIRYLPFRIACLTISSLMRAASASTT